MPARESYAQGTPNWVDLQTTDQAAAKALYGEVFGWTYDDQPMDAGAVYSIAKIGDGQVAAIAPQSPELKAAGAPSMWNTYLAVDSVDDATAVSFYEQVLGVTTTTADMGEDKYTMFEAGGQQVGGTMPPQMAGVPNHWHVYFAVADADATVAKIKQLNGSVVVEPFDTPIGKMAVVADPQGAVFSLFQAAPSA